MNNGHLRITQSPSFAAVLTLLAWVLLVIHIPNALAQEHSEADDSNQSTATTSTQNLTLDDNQQLPRSEKGQQIHREMEEVLKGKEFGEEKTVTRWRWIDTEDAETREQKFPEWLIDTYDFFDRHADTIKTVSAVLEVVLWAALVALIVFLVIRYRESIGNFVAGAMNAAPEPELPASLMGIDLKKVVLPKDIPAEAMALWQQKNHRMALALLLRASLIKLLKEHRVKLYDSDTEAECCDRIEQQASSNISGFMRDLVTTWQGLAYAHIVPSEQAFSDLCQRWPNVFGSSNAFRPVRNEVTHAE